MTENRDADEIICCDWPRRGRASGTVCGHDMLQHVMDATFYFAFK